MRLPRVRSRRALPLRALKGSGASGTERGAYGDYYDPRTGGSYGARGIGESDDEGHTGAITTGSETAGTVGPGMSMGDTETGEFREHDRDQEGVSQPGSNLEDGDELRVQCSEEELRGRTREREAGAMRIRKRVRTDREGIEIPTRREEVSVERVPMIGEAIEAQIGGDKVEIPVVEEEVVVDKRAVAREEIRPLSTTKKVSSRTSVAG